MRILLALRPYLAVACLASIAWCGWIFYSRRTPERPPTPLTPEQAALDRLYRSDEVKILSFSARDAVVEIGKKTVICYGVLNAREVRIEPSIGETTPTLSRCLEASPKADTHYVLTATGKNGAAVQAAIDVFTVRGPSPAKQGKGHE